MDRLIECQGKIASIRAEIAKRNACGAVIRKQNNFAWATCGGRGFIGIASEISCCALVVTQSAVYLVSNNIESGRLIAEELPEGFAQPVSLPWQADGQLAQTIAELCGGDPVDDVEMEPFFKTERSNLNDAELARYRDLGQNSAASLEEVCKTIQPGATEFAIAGAIAQALWARGIEPITLLVAADDRSERIRHYVPTAKAAKCGFIASICARRWGLIASATRVVAFADDFAMKDKALAEVERAALEALIPGKPMSSVYQAIQTAYAAAGLPGEENNHHQGGLTGYMAREIRVDAATDCPIRIGQAFAWNPSARGIKCEDTVALTSSGVEILTSTGADWPTAIIGNRRRPLALRRG